MHLLVPTQQHGAGKVPTGMMKRQVQSSAPSKLRMCKSNRTFYKGLGEWARDNVRIRPTVTAGKPTLHLSGTAWMEAVLATCRQWPDMQEYTRTAKTHLRCWFPGIENSEEQRALCSLWSHLQVTETGSLGFSERLLSAGNLCGFLSLATMRVCKENGQMNCTSQREGCLHFWKY